jgi:hypothetical protein
LKDIRNNLEQFLSRMGYDPVLFERGGIAFEHDEPLDKSAYNEIGNCHMQILIIGGRYGSPSSSSKELDDGTGKNKMYERYYSITRKEYETARKIGIPIYVFVEKGVYWEYQTYRMNRENESINYMYVDSINIFELLDEILSEKVGNYIKIFENFEDIASWLTGQWAGLFAEYLIYKNNEQKIKTIESQIEDLKSITMTLKKYTEALMEEVIPDESVTIIKDQNKIMKRNLAKNFVNEPLIVYLLNLLRAFSVDVKIKENEEMLDKFRDSSNLLEFFISLGGYIGLFNTFPKNLQDDFEYVKRRYQASQET